MSGLCPFATHRLIPAGSNDPAIKPRAAILHVADMLGPSLWDFFAHRSGGIESHFYIRLDGTIEQYRDIFFQADANLDANDFAVSIETEGKAAGKWTAEQIASIQRLLLWLHLKAGIPLRKIDRWDGSGVGYHTLFGAPSHWTPVAKSCPGPDRIKQFNAVIVPWMRLQSAPKPDPAPAAEPTKQPATRVLKGATWNLRVGRNPNKVLAELLEFLDEFDIDVMTVMEAAGYVRSLRRPLRRHGYTLQAFPRLGGSARDSAVIVRKGLTVRRKWLHRLETTGWKKGHGRPGLHWPRSAVSVGVERIRVVAVHQAPGPFGGAFSSRGVANEAGFATLTKLARRWNRRKQAWVMAGDWNRRIGDPVVGQFAQTTGAALLGHGIDWVASRGVKVTAVVEHKFGTSDHNPKTFTITR